MFCQVSQNWHDHHRFLKICNVRAGKTEILANVSDFLNPPRIQVCIKNNLKINKFVF